MFNNNNLVKIKIKKLINKKSKKVTIAHLIKCIIFSDKSNINLSQKKITFKNKRGRE